VILLITLNAEWRVPGVNKAAVDIRTQKLVGKMQVNVIANDIYFH